MIVAHICCIIPMSYLIYCSRFNRRVLNVKSMSATLSTFIIVHVIGATSVLPYRVYLIVKWAQGTNGITVGYDPYLLLLLGMWEPVYFGLSTASAFYLTLDRCLGLRFPLRFNTIGKVFTPLSVVCLVMFGFVFLCGSLVEVPLDINKTLNCQTYNCVTYKYQNMVTGFTRITFGVLNTILMCHFLHVLKRTGIDIVNDNLVKVTLLLEVALTTVPLLGTRIFALVTGLNSANYIGETIILMYALNSAICAVSLKFLLPAAY
ncbi:hypothetical protein Ddc_18532 [Ditylenchus destructor]|nr:hypothetical protein Ddc_18532 [Ditylenchus destructor]